MPCVPAEYIGAGAQPSRPVAVGPDSGASHAARTARTAGATMRRRRREIVLCSLRKLAADGALLFACRNRGRIVTGAQETRLVETFRRLLVQCSGSALDKVVRTLDAVLGRLRGLDD